MRYAYSWSTLYSEKQCDDGLLGCSDSPTEGPADGPAEGPAGGPVELSEACPTKGPADGPAEGLADGPAELSEACPTEDPAHGAAGGPASVDRRIRPTHRVYNIQPHENTSFEKGLANNYDGSSLPAFLAHLFVLFSGVGFLAYFFVFFSGVVASSRSLGRRLRGERFPANGKISSERCN